MVKVCRSRAALKASPDPSSFGQCVHAISANPARKIFRYPSSLSQPSLMLMYNNLHCKAHNVKYNVLEVTFIKSNRSSNVPQSSL